MKPGLLPFIAALLPVAASAASPSITIRPADRTWEMFGLAERVSVLGELVDPDCPSVTLLRLRPETRLPPHSAPVDRTYLLLSGTIHVGIGRKWDEARMRTLPAGSFWVVPADTSTFEWAEGEAVCQVVAMRAARDCPRPKEATISTPDQIAWEPLGRAERARLYGEPGLPECPYVERFRLPASSAPELPAGAPSDDVVWTVLTGTLHRTSGSEEQSARSLGLPAGTVALLPATAGVIGADPTGVVAQRQFTGTGPRVCRWRGLHR